MLLQANQKVGLITLQLKCGVTTNRLLSVTVHGYVLSGAIVDSKILATKKYLICEVSLTKAEMFGITLHGGAIWKFTNLIAQIFCVRCPNTIHALVGILKTVSPTNGLYAFVKDAGGIKWQVVSFTLMFIRNFLVFMDTIIYSHLV